MFVNQSEKDKELEKLVSEYVSNEEVEQLNELLINWTENSLQWLIYVESRMMAPSTSKSHKEKLKDIRKQALLEPELTKAYHDYIASFSFEEPETETIEDFITTFDYSEEEKEQYKILESLDDIGLRTDEEPSEELDGLLGQIDIENQSPFIQHQAFKIIYNLLYADHEILRLKKYSEMPIYQKWNNRFAPGKISKNSNLTIAVLKEFCSLEYQLELLRRKGYYDYLIQNDDVDTSFENFFKKYASHYKYGEQTSNKKRIQEFEQLYSVKLPKELQQFYETLGCFHGQVHLQINIWSIDEAIKKKSNTEDKNGMGGVGLADVISYFAWEEIFTKEEILKLNSEYVAVGYVALNDDFSEVLIPYFDQKGKFDFVIFNAKNVDGTFKDFIDPMLKNSQAKHSFIMLLTAILLPISTTDFGFFKGEGDLSKQILNML